MATDAQIEKGPTFPRLTSDEVKVFLASQDSDRREAALESLSSVGLGKSIHVVADNYDAADEIIWIQAPHSLSANVFIIDALLFRNMAGLRYHGRHLAEQLLRNYKAPAQRALREAQRQFVSLGMTEDDASALFAPDSRDVLDRYALTQLHSEALVIGMGTEEGHAHTIGDAAQIPSIDPRRVGPVILANTVVPPQV